MKDLSYYREKIDECDQKLVELISKRGKLAQSIGKIKKAKGKAIYVPSREQKIYRRLEKLNEGPYNTEALISIFREIISATRALEAPISVAYLGPEATFTHLASLQYFGTSAESTPQPGIETIFSQVEKGQMDYGVVPIENSTEGVVSHTLDMFVDSDLKIYAEIVLRIRHHLLSNQTDLSKIEAVYSHPHALAQCRSWLLSHIPNAILKPVESTAKAAKIASQEKNTAAIASEIASNVHGLPIIEKEIQDQVRNFTRFLVIGKDSSPKSGHDKTSLLLTLKDEVGGLYKVLSPLAKAKVNLTKIESRPMKNKAWEYLFFVDLDGHAKDKVIAKVLNEIKEKCVFFKVLGSYPKNKID